MGLKNAQYDTIIREFNRRQLDHKREQNDRVQNAYEQAPELGEIDGQIASLSVSKARQILNGEEASIDSLKHEIEQLSLERSRILEAHGLPADHLELHFACPDCQDTGYIGNQKCHCFKQAVIDMLYTQSNMKEILNYENFSHFSFSYYSENMIDPATGLSARAAMQKIVAEAKAFIRSFSSSSGNLFFYGDTGVGKTFLSHCIAKELIDTAHSVIYFTAFELFDLFSKTTFRRGYGEEDLQQMHTYIFDCDLLIIDDLGTELTNSFVSSQLFLCINERLLRKRSTIISTNLPMDMFRDTYSERIFSRISSHYTMRKFIGDDIRIQKKLNGFKP